MKKGLTLKTAARWMNAATESDQVAFGASVDSRLITKGDLYFACPGKRNDGHEFLAEVSDKGASGAVVSKSYSGDSFGLPLMRVENPEVALQQLARHFLASLPAKVIGITGSAGKTTTKGFLAHFLASKYKIAATPGNYNSQLGVPLTILNHVTDEQDFVVLEMGMTQAGHIASLVQIAPPDLGIITGVSLAHAENFTSLEAIGQAKGEIFSHPKTKQGIVDRSIVNFDALVSEHNHCHFISFGCDLPEADCSLFENEGILSLCRKGSSVAVFDSFSVMGKHNRHNFLAAALAAHHCGLSWQSIRDSARTLSLPPMRLQVEEREGITFINDAYNALPIAVKGALDSLPTPQAGGRKIAVLSEMRELGHFSAACHQEIGEYALSRVDVLLCMGPACASIQAVWKAADREVVWVAELKELEAHLKSIARPGDVILVKGSRASGLSSLPDGWAFC